MYTRQPYLYNLKKGYYLYELGLKCNKTSFYQIPFLKKIILNLSDKNLNQKYIEDFMGTLKLISLKNTKTCRAQKMNLNLKIKKDQISGFQVILQSYTMWHFLIKFVSTVQVKHPFFKGLNFKYKDNLATTVYPHYMLFPEVSIDTAYLLLNIPIFPKLYITYITTADTKLECKMIVHLLQN